MIVAKQITKDFITNQNEMPTFADKIGVTKQTLYNLINGENISSEIIAKLIKATGFSFEKAFEIKE